MVFSVYKIKPMKQKKIISLATIGVLSQLTLACSDFYTTHSDRVQPIKVSLLYENTNRPTAEITRQTVNADQMAPVLSLSANTGAAQGAPVRRDNVPPPAHFSQSSSAAEFVPQTVATDSQQHLQPVTTPPPDIPLDLPPASPPPVAAVEPPPPVSVIDPVRPETPPPPPVIIDRGPSATRPVAALSTPAATVEPVPTVRTEPRAEVPPAIIDHGAPVAPVETNTVTALAAEPPAGAPVPSVSAEPRTAVPPAIIDHGPRADSSAVVAMDTATPSSDTMPPVTAAQAQTAAPPSPVAEPSITPLAADEADALQAEVAALLAQPEIAPLAEYIKRYELDFARYPQVQRLRVARDQRCRTAAQDYLQKGAGAFQAVYGEVCPYQTFMEAARQAQ